MDVNNIKKYYSEIINYQQSRLSKLRNTIFQIGTLRLMIVLVCIIASYIFWDNSLSVVGIISISLIIFLLLMSFHSKLFKEKRYREQKTINAQNELKGLDYDFSAYDGASDKINQQHSFSFDLDLFGERSFFQSINRTVTSFGKDTLANTLIHSLKTKESILNRQHAIKELKEKRKLLAHFRAMGQTTAMDNLNTKNLAQSFAQSILLNNSLFWKIAIWIVPCIYILLGILVYLEILSGTLFLPIYILSFILSAIPGKKVGLIMSTFDSKSQVLNTYTELFRIIENEKFESPQLIEIQKQLKTNTSASEAIGKLKSLLNNLMMSAAYPILLLINPVLLWNVRYSIKVEKWTQDYKNVVLLWFDAISEFDALVSWGIFAFNHPNYTYPQPNTDKFIFKGISLGHPMLNSEACVRNDIDISQTPYFMVITGANMAGKSTYLRTIGINHTIACAGAPVCAESLIFYPGNLVTNLRTVDSLADNESYFFAELKRLKMIIDRLKAGEELFIILDEILKGTNSIDKQKGSLALMKQLVSLNGNGIIATHDLLLGTLEKEYPDNIKNYRFEADITDNHLSFTYKIREGIAQNMNASYLMKQMGITGL